MGRKQMWILLVCVFTLLFLSGCSAMNEQVSAVESHGFRWIREESCLVDYTISDDTIQFRYAFRFENNSESDISLSCLNAAFKKSELRDWLKYEKFYNGVLENGDPAITIKAGEKVTAVYVFSGEYLGGPVYENLSVPDVTMIQDYE